MCYKVLTESGSWRLSEIHKMYSHRCNLVHFYYSCLSSFPVFNLLAILPVLILKNIRNLTAADHSRTPALVPASVFSHLEDFHNLLPAWENLLPCSSSDIEHNTNPLPGKVAHITDLMPYHSTLSCSVLVTLALPGLKSAKVIPASGHLHRLFSSSGMFFAQMCSWLTLPFYSERLSQLPF